MYAKTRMDLQNSMFSEISQMQVDKHRMSPPTWGISNKQSQRQKVD